MCHVPSVLNDLWSQIHAPPRTRQHTTADNESVTKAIASFYRDDSDTVYLGLSYDLRSDIIPANFLWVKCIFHLVMTEAGSGKVLAISEDFRRIPKIDFQTLPKIKCPQMFRQTSNKVLPRFSRGRLVASLMFRRRLSTSSLLHSRF